MNKRCYFSDQDIDNMIFSSVDKSFDYKPSNAGTLINQVYGCLLLPNLIKIAITAYDKDPNQISWANYDNPIKKAWERFKGLVYIISDALQKPEDLNKEYDVETLKKEDSLVGIILRYSSVLEENKCALRQTLRRLVVLNSDKGSFKFGPYLEDETLDLIKKLLKRAVKELGKALNSKELSEISNTISTTRMGAYEPVEEMPENVILKHFFQDGTRILIKDVNITTANMIPIINLLSVCNVYLLDTVMFHNCTFKDDLEFPITYDIKLPVIFRKCTFEKNFRFPYIAQLMVRFRECLFKGNIIASKMTFKSSLMFEKCVFDIHSSLSLNEVCFLKGTVGFNIINSIIMGSLKFEKVSFEECPFKISNTSFMGSIYFNKTLLPRNTLIDNICFPTKISAELKESQKNLYQTLINSDLTDLANDLNLIKSLGKGYSEDKYKAALVSGWLSPEFAAIYLNSTVGYLAKRRWNDKHHCGKKSIPFKGSAKGLKYPVKALDAKIAQNWEKLAEIREKMDFPNNILKEQAEKRAAREKKKQP